MLETIMLALMATFFGIIIAFPLSFFAARNLMAPISSPLRTLVGGLFLLVPALWLAGRATSLVATSLGGLERAPIPIAAIGLILVLLFGFIGFTLGARILSALNHDSAESRTSLITALLAAPLGAIVGWVVGLGIAYGIVSIPLSAEVVAAATVSTPFPIISSFAGGLSFSSKHVLPVGTIISIKIPFIQPVFKAVGRVSWCRPENDQFEVGIEFLDKEDMYRTRMVEQICHIEQYRQEVLKKEGRKLSSKDAAHEWIQKFAPQFPGSE